MAFEFIKYFNEFPRIAAGMTLKSQGETESIYGLGHMGILSASDPESAKDHVIGFIQQLGLQPDMIYATEQVHKTDIVCLESLTHGSEIVGLEGTIRKIEKTDGLLTNQSGVFMMTFYADCTPILLYDPETHSGGIVHSGWRGTAEKIVSHAVTRMVDCYGADPTSIRAVVAPSAGQCCYEVDEFVKSHFPGLEQFFHEVEGKNNHYKMDLKGINAQWLYEAGVSRDHIQITKECTICDTRFYSFRREYGDTGRMTAFMMLR